MCDPNPIPKRSSDPAGTRRPVFTTFYRTGGRLPRGLPIGSAATPE